MFASFLELKEAHEATVKVFIRAIEAKDPYTAGHAERVVVRKVEQLGVDHAGSEVTLAKHRVGTVLGEMSVFDDQPRSASAQAMADTTVRVLRRDRLQAIVHEHPEVMLEFIRNLSQRLRAMDEKLESARPSDQSGQLPINGEELPATR